jgi:hypothetical protein
MTGRRDEPNEWPRPTPHRLLHDARRAPRLPVATECQRPPGRLVRPSRPTLREPSFVRLELCSLRPPPLQELGSRRHRVDDGHALVVLNHTDLQRLSSHRRSDEHRHRRVVGDERSPVMSNCVEHVVVVDAVLSAEGSTSTNAGYSPSARSSTSVDGHVAGGGASSVGSESACSADWRDLGAAVHRADRQMWRKSVDLGAPRT